MRNDRLSSWHIRQLARRIVERRLAFASNGGLQELRQAAEGETPLSVAEVAFAIEKGIILGPVDVRALRTRFEPLQPSVPALRCQDDPRPSGDAPARGAEEGALPQGARGLDAVRPRGSGPQTAFVEGAQPW